MWSPGASLPAGSARSPRRLGSARAGLVRDGVGERLELLGGDLELERALAHLLAQPLDRAAVLLQPGLVGRPVVHQQRGAGAKPPRRRAAAPGAARPSASRRTCARRRRACASRAERAARAPGPRARPASPDRTACGRAAGAARASAAVQQPARGGVRPDHVPSGGAGGSGLDPPQHRLGRREQRGDREAAGPIGDDLGARVPLTPRHSRGSGPRRRAAAGRRRSRRARGRSDRPTPTRARRTARGARGCAGARPSRVPRGGPRRRPSVGDRA